MNLIIAGDLASALTYAKRRGFRGPKIITKMADFLEWDGSLIDVAQYTVHIVYGGIKPEVMRRIQELTTLERQKENR